MAAAAIKEIFSGMDVTGDPKYAYSQVYSFAMMCSMITVAIGDLFTPLHKVKWQPEDWAHLIFFAVYMTSCVGLYVLVALISVGNAKHPVKTARYRAAFSLVMVTLLCCGLRPFVLFKHDYYHTGVLVFNLSTMVILYIAAAIPMVQRLLGHEKKEGAVVLQSDTQDGAWQDDDIVGFIKACGVQEDFLFRGNDSVMVKPGPVPCIKGFFYPQPFAESHRFPNFVKTAAVAKRAKITLPTRLFVGLFCSACLVSFSWYLLVFHVGEPYLRDCEKFATELIPGISSKAEMDAMLVDVRNAEQKLNNYVASLEGSGLTEILPSVTSALTGAFTQACLTEVQNLGSAAMCLNAVNTAYQDQLKLQQDIKEAEAYLVNAQKELKEAEDAVEALVDDIKRALIILIVGASISALLSFWFMYVQVLAYRKTALELLVSRPFYRFHPKLQNCTKDKRFAAVIGISFSLAFSLLVIVFEIVVFLLSWDDLWKLIFDDYLDAVVAFAIYQGFAILIVPKAHEMMVLGKDGYLSRPFAQSVCLLVFEFFYFPQTVVSIILKAVFSLGISIAMFLRPDETILPHQWYWLDGLHLCYVGSVYEHLQTGMRCTDVTAVCDKVVPTPGSSETIE